MSLSAHAARMEAVPGFKDALARGRERVSAQLLAMDRPRVGLAALRARIGLSQTDLADRLGMPQGNVSRWEKDPSSIRTGNYKKLAAALEITRQELFAAICCDEEAE